MNTPERSGADALLETLLHNNITRLFVNLGTDHTGIIEALARRKNQGQPNPEVFICPHEILAISAAHGIAALTGQPQALLVHVDSGTQNLGGGVHNAMRGRVPLLILAGTSPMTLRGERKGSRADFVTYIQDVNDQNAIVRQYMKWDYKMPTGVNLPEVVQRALQIATQAPQGPVYLSFPREVMEDLCQQSLPEPARYSAAIPSALSEATLLTVARQLIEAENPLIVSSYSGRNPATVAALVGLAELLGAGVCDVQSRLYNNFPMDHPQYLGVIPEQYYKDADLVFLVDVDIPWLHGQSEPPSTAKIIHLDIDPLKPTIPLWTFPADLRLQADSSLVIPELIRLCRDLIAAKGDAHVRETRRETLHQRREANRIEYERLAQDSVAGGKITPAWLSYCLAQVCGDNTVVLDEAVSNRIPLLSQLQLSRPGSYLGLPGTALGWANNAAFGVKLAQPRREVIAVMGDGSFNFSVPNAVYWAANRYNVPFLTVIYNNQGWNAVKRATLSQYSEGYASQTNDFSARFEQPIDIPALARACHAWAESVSDPTELPAMLQHALQKVRSGRAAVLDVRLEPI
jgi:acetolactate synthase-1/2/3 large subunit